MVFIFIASFDVKKRLQLNKLLQSRVDKCSRVSHMMLFGCFFSLYTVPGDNYADSRSSTGTLICKGVFLAYFFGFIINSVLIKFCKQKQSPHTV